MKYLQIECVIRGTCVFFFNDTATTEIYTLSLHDALPISAVLPVPDAGAGLGVVAAGAGAAAVRRRLHRRVGRRSEEHTSELQSRQYLVCRLLLEKKQTRSSTTIRTPRSPSGRTPTSSSQT